MDWLQKSDFALAHQNCSNKGCTATAAISWKHQIELVLNTHQLTDSWLHNVGEMGMIAKHASYNKKGKNTN